MNYKEFVKLCVYNARNSIKVENMKQIVPIRTDDVEINLINDNRLSISSSRGTDIIFAENNYFKCDEIIKSIAKVYEIEYVDNTIRNLLTLQQELFKIIGINEGV